LTSKEEGKLSKPPQNKKKGPQKMEVAARPSPVKKERYKPNSKKSLIEKDQN